MSQKRKIWKISGMHCVHCEAVVRKALSNLPGLQIIDVSYRRGTLTANWDSSLVSEQQIRDHLRADDYDLRQTGALMELLKLAALLVICVVLFQLILRNPVISRLNLFPTASAGMSLGAVFVVGLMTSLHCVAMCGGINLSQSADSAIKGSSLWRTNLRYNLGRLVSYTLTGCLVGAIGGIFSPNAQIKAAIQLAAAVFMVIMACNLSGLFPYLQRFSIHLPRSWLTRLPLLNKLDSSFGIGLLNGLMPCGPLQSMQLFALATGSWWMGGLSMLCFALGTIPLMYGFGLAGGLLNRRFGRPLQWISACLVLFMGIGMLTNAVTLFGINTAAPSETQLLARISEDETVQTLTTELEWNSYPTFSVKSGIPVQWTMHADADKIIGCNNEILIPAYDVDVILHEGDNLITFTPNEAGVIPYSCWMGMMKASIIVTEP